MNKLTSVAIAVAVLAFGSTGIASAQETTTNATATTAMPSMMAYANLPSNPNGIKGAERVADAIGSNRPSQSTDDLAQAIVTIDNASLDLEYGS
jgi:hypothetical protein